MAGTQQVNKPEENKPKVKSARMSFSTSAAPKSSQKSSAAAAKHPTFKVKLLLKHGECRT
jgi:hypothetical protein